MKTTKTECKNCGKALSDRFVSVFGNENGEIYGCIDCMDRSTLRNGGGAVQDVSEIAYPS